MRKILLLLLFVSQTLLAQTLVLLPEGLRSEADNTKTYVVINADGMKADKLYTNAYNYIQKAYVDPQKVAGGNVENEYLSANTFKKNISYYPAAMFKYPIDVKYTIMLTFKDERIKIEFGNIQYNLYTGQPSSVPFQICGSTMSSFPVYTNKGKLFRENVKQDIEKYFNNEIKTLSKAIKGETSKNDEW